jgi:hypothetical protein
MMISAKHSLERIPPKNRDNTYSQILHLLDSYINTNCKHTIIREIDNIYDYLSPIVYYCDNCYTEFADFHGTPKKISSQCK